MGTGPSVQAWSPVAAAPIPDTQGPGVCPRAACGGASQGLPRPLVPPLPQTQTPRVSAVLPQGAEPSPGPRSPAPTPVCSHTHVSSSDGKDKAVHTRVWAEGAPSSRFTEGTAPASPVHFAASGHSSSRPRLTGPGPRRSHELVFKCVSSHWAAGDDPKHIFFNK